MPIQHGELHVRLQGDAPSGRVLIHQALGEYKEEQLSTQAHINYTGYIESIAGVSCQHRHRSTTQYIEREYSWSPLT